METPKVETLVKPEKPKAPETPVQPKVETPKVEAPVEHEKPKSAKTLNSNRSGSQTKAKILPQTGDISLVGIGLISLMGALSSKKRKK